MSGCCASRAGGGRHYRQAPRQLYRFSGRKLFEVQEGTITFRDDPANPIVVATAAWESPEGIMVFAEYKGLVDRGRLSLRAEPALSKDQIVKPAALRFDRRLVR